MWRREAGRLFTGIIMHGALICVVMHGALTCDAMHGGMSRGGWEERKKKQAGTPMDDRPPRLCTLGTPRGSKSKHVQANMGWHTKART